MTRCFWVDSGEGRRIPGDRCVLGRWDFNIIVL